MRFLRLTLVTLLSTCGVFSCIASIAADQPIDYMTQIKPILRERCYACHGALKQLGDLRLDTVQHITKGGSSGSAVNLEAAASSLLIQRVSAAEESERMPPEGRPLTAEQIELLRQWIQQNAKGPADEQPERDPHDHWAFRKPLRPVLPVVKHQDWVLTPIDTFIVAEHERRGLKVQPVADRRLWLRRVTLDLIGLPPTQEEQDAFVADHSSDAFEKVVNRLLESPQYGERWGRHWMDVWRYSDPWGLGPDLRNSSRHMWHWRDWIIESLNADVGYDQMLREMIAADELYPQDLQKLRASGFMARQYYKFNRAVWLDDTIEHVSKAMLGLTMNCAKCHDHKYDPLSHQDYYSFRAIFEPYQVRTDFLPGEIDVTKAGLPRAFDCNLDTPTYLLIRGDDRNPDKSRVLAPAVPGILGSDKWSITPIELPNDAIQPGLRPFVVEAWLKDADSRIAAARSELEQLEKRLADPQAAENMARLKLSEGGKDVFKDEIVDDFSVERSDLWQQRGGIWNHVNGHLKQTHEGPTRSVLTLKAEVPVNFEAHFKYVPLGGQTWKSVGINFDVNGTQHEVLAYLSSYADGPKSQICYTHNAQTVYPPEGAQPRMVALNQSHELLLRVRGTLVNLTVDGEHSIAYRLPIAREPGPLEILTFDAQAEFHRFSVKPLPADVTLIEPASSSPAQVIASLPSEQADAMLAIARKSLATAMSLPSSIRARSAADLAQSESPAPEYLASRIADAVRAERMTAAAKADEEVSRAELAVLKATAETQEDLKKKLDAARQALDAALKLVDEPGTTYTPLNGAVKTVESNMETAESQAKPFPRTSTGRRTALASWLTDRQNPLTARVAVNHIWARHLGTPLVPTVFEFGRKGTPPTHPELLDWLAVELMDHRWSMKHIHRIIVMSNAYRMTSSIANADQATVAADPDNKFYWHAVPLRMEAQMIRDSLLFIAGELDLTRGGPSIPVSDEGSRRRSLYFVHSHNDHEKFLSMFDDANVLDCYRRSESIVPQQALALENSSLAATMAEKIASRIGGEQPAMNDEEFVRTAFKRVLSFEPSPQETSAVLDGLKQLVELAQRQNVAQPETFGRTAVILALINHNDFITVR